MRALVTGATGLVGSAIAKLLLERGHRVRALVRRRPDAQLAIPRECELAQGDVTDPGSLAAAMREIDWVFHAAGIPEQWQRDEAIFDRVNHLGTVNVLEAALAAHVRRVIYSSTMDVFAAPPGGTLVETTLDEAPKPSAYERSKVAADRAAVAIAARGLEVVHLNPAAVYGPGPSLTAANALFAKTLRRQIPLCPPGGMPLVYIDGVAAAQLAAAERGVPGERYLLADGHMSVAELVAAIHREAGLGSPPPTAPRALVKALAALSAPIARLLGGAPLVAPGELFLLLWDVRVDASKAQRELGFAPTPLAEGIAKTVAWLRPSR